MEPEGPVGLYGQALGGAPVNPSLQLGPSGCTAGRNVQRSPYRLLLLRGRNQRINKALNGLW